MEGGSVVKIRQMPIGVEDFEKIRKENLYYVDKTNLITDILLNWGEVKLFTRPRRFGKTLTMSMLKYFFEIGTDKSLFDGLAISKEKELCEQHMGKFPVISISLKEVDGLSFESAYEQLRGIIRKEAFRLKILRNSTAIDDSELESFNKIYDGKDDSFDIKSSLEMFSRLLEKHYNQKVIILIDEYDVPLQKAYDKGYYPQMIEVIRSLLSAALKTNNSLYFAILTGCLRVTKESIFTGLNNLKVHSISDDRFDEYFGFTNDEVKKMLSDYNLERHYDEIKHWYDGYLFGNQEIYCPWDVINYCDDLINSKYAEPQAYWLHSSGNDAIRELINKIDDKDNEEDTKTEIEKLLSGETITKKLNEQLTHSEIYDNVTNIWSLLYMTGYLTVSTRVKSGVYNLRIPNLEIQQIFRSEVLKWFKKKVKENPEQSDVLYTALVNSDTKTIEDYLSKMIRTSISYFDGKEAFYHGFLLALLAAKHFWKVSSNDEAGSGRADIILKKGDNELAVVIELKAVKDIKKLDDACQSAIKQIEEKEYASELIEHEFNKILAYGIAFCGKKCKVIVKEIV